MRKPLPPLQQIPAETASVEDYEALAQARMDDGTWAYFNQGAADGITLRDNRAAFARVRLRNRVLCELSDGHTRLSLFGQDYAHPIFVAPVAFQTLAHPQGERATVLAAAAMQAGMVVSTQASLPLEELATVAPAAPLWFQLYIQPDRDFTLALVRRAEAAGYRALVLTVDASVAGLRNAEQRAGFVMPQQVEAINLRGMRDLPPQVARAGQSPLFGSALVNAAPTWRDLDWLRAHTRLPILLKGVLAGDDARRALDHGIDGLIVSNHGGRTLDTAPATLDALPAVVQVVGGCVPVLLDGGIRRGTDVLKALALGAAAVLVGRPVVHGLAAAGATGVAHVLHLLRTELELAMVQCGCRRLSEIDRRVLWSPQQNP